MKKNDVILILSVAIYSYLFYAQSAGINFLLFSLFLTGALVIRNGAQRILLNPSWWLSAAGSIISAVCVCLYGNTLSVISNILSLSLLAAFSLERHTSLVFAGLYSMYSYISAVAFMFVDWAEKLSRKQNGELKSGVKFLMILIPVLISLVFFFIYQQANPLFKNFTANWSLDFITWPWMRFTLGGFVLMYGFFYHRTIALIHEKDMRATNTLNRENFSLDKNKLFGFDITISNEVLTGIILFSLLNILLLSVNALDLQYVWLTDTLPEGMTFSESVHQGVGALITSIVLAVLVILVYFRGNINFYNGGKTIKILAYIWILQNAFLILSTVLRNQLYINEYSLTYKRIGVYVYLTLCLIGLFTTLIKIASAKSNWYLFRVNSWLFYGVLVISCVFNWDRMITKFNLDNSRTIDRDYLVNLSSTNTGLLLESPEFQDNNRTYFTSQGLHKKVFDFLNFYQQKEWKSWNEDDVMVYDAIHQAEQKGMINSLNLSSASISSLKPLSRFIQLKNIELSNNQFKSLEELAFFREIENISLRSNGLDSIHKLPALNSLKAIDLSSNAIKDFNALKRAPQLEVLNISGNRLEDLQTFPKLVKLHTLDLSYNPVTNLSQLGELKSLRILGLNDLDYRALETLPVLENLEELSFRDNTTYHGNTEILTKISSMRNLKKLDMSSCELANLYVAESGLFTAKMKTGDLSSLPYYFPVSLQSLTLSRNKLLNLQGIERLTALETLDLTGNGLSNTGPLAGCVSIRTLYLRDNVIENIKALSGLRLKSLDLANNRIYDLSPLAQMDSLEVLRINNNQISDLNALKGLKQLRVLDLSYNNGILDLSPLTSLKTLEELNLNGSQLKNPEVLYSMKNLKKLNCNLDEKQMIKLKTQLPVTEINNIGQALPVNEYTETTSSETL